MWPKTVSIEYDEILHDTGGRGATLFQIGDDEVWIPNSLIEEDWGDAVEVPVWFAEKEGLI